MPEPTLTLQQRQLQQQKRMQQGDPADGANRPWRSLPERQEQAVHRVSPQSQQQSSQDQ